MAGIREGLNAMNIDAHPNYNRTNEKSPRRVVVTTVTHAPSHCTLRLTMPHIPKPIPRFWVI